MIWQSGVKGHLKTKLNSLQRQALLMMGHFRNGTPTAGLEAIAGTMPLDLHLEMLALKTYIRIEDQLSEFWVGMKKPRIKSHLKHCMSLKAQTDEEVTQNKDDIVKCRNSCNKFTLKKWSLDEGKDQPLTNLSCYTDGSKIHGHTGWGAVIMTNNDQDPITYSGKLSPASTVFQAEAIAMTHSAHYIDHFLSQSPATLKHVKILTDSQALFKALDSKAVKSKTVNSVIKALNILATDCTVEIYWIKAHIGHHGNELADKAAKDGALGDDLPRQTASSGAGIKAHLTHLYMEKWKTRWRKLKTCRQTKIWLPEIDLGVSKQLLRQKRHDYGTTVRWITGHNFLKRHTALFDPDNVDANCRFCELEPETSSHLITTCEVFWQNRADCFKQFFLDETTPVWKPKQLLKFLQSKNIRDLEAENLPTPTHLPNPSPPPSSSISVAGGPSGLAAGQLSPTDP
jgi:ribonuclease HI